MRTYFGDTTLAISSLIRDKISAVVASVIGFYERSFQYLVVAPGVGTMTLALANMRTILIETVGKGRSAGLCVSG
jgi:hypothetical protein